MRHRLLAILVSLLLTPFVAACAGDDPSAVTTAGNGPTRQVTVYDFARVHGDLLLFPSRITVPDSGDPVLDAVRGLFEHRPTAHGHESLWVGDCAPGLGVRGTHVTRQVVTVDVQAYPPDDVPNATCDLSVEGWNVQKQQLAWTVRTADGEKAPVRGTLDGGYTFLERTTARTRYLASSH
jgi:hypothetical protein